jgi:hypothetical protein
MMLVPAATPVTVPVLFTVATAVVPLLHTPLEVASESDVVLPTATVVVPEIAEGFGLTVMVFTTRHPVAKA